MEANRGWANRNFQLAIESQSLNPWLKSKPPCPPPFFFFNIKNNFAKYFNIIAKRWRTSRAKNPYLPRLQHWHCFVYEERWSTTDNGGKRVQTWFFPAISIFNGWCSLWVEDENDSSGMNKQKTSKQSAVYYFSIILERRMLFSS